jgi:pyruvate carboxylase
VNLEKTREELSEKIHRDATETDLASYLMYPQVFLEFERFRKHYGDVAMIPTTAFFYGLQPYQEIPIEIESGKTILVRFLTVGDPDPDGLVTVFFELNGQPREVKVPDRKRAITKVERPKADAMNPAHVGAPMPGKITAVNVSLGQPIQKGTKLLSIEAMKMETAVYSPREGKVVKIDVQPGNLVAAGDLLVEIG